MTEVSQEIREQIKHAVTDGDLKRLKALVSQFPESFASFDGQKPEENLVDLAWKNRRDDVTIYLIVERGFEVSPKFKTEKKEYFGAEQYQFKYGAQELHNTMEVLASAIFNTRPLDYLRCHTLTEWAVQGGDVPSYIQNPLNPEFVKQITSGNLSKFVAKTLSDDRAEMILCAHSIVMLSAINDRIDSIEEKYRNEISGEDKSGGPKRSNRQH